MQTDTHEPLKMKIPRWIILRMERAYQTVVERRVHPEERNLSKLRRITGQLTQNTLKCCTLSRPVIVDSQQLGVEHRLCPTACRLFLPEVRLSGILRSHGQSCKLFGCQLYRSCACECDDIWRELMPCGLPQQQPGCRDHRLSRYLAHLRFRVTSSSADHS